MSESSEHVQQTRMSSAVFVLIVSTLVVSVLAYGSVEPWSFAVVTVLTGLIAVCWLADAFFSKEIKIATSPIQIPLWALALLGIVQLLPFGSAPSDGGLSVPTASAMTIDPFATRMFVARLVVLGVFFGAAQTYVSSADRLRRIVAIIVGFAGLMAFFGILQSIASTDGIYGWRPTPQALPFASFVNRHHFAALMEMTIGLTLALLVGRGTGKDKRLLLVIALILMGIALVFTGSRGGLLSLIAVVAFVFFGTYLRAHKDDSDEPDEHVRNSGFRRKLGIAGGIVGAMALIAGAVVLLGGDASLTRGIGFTGQADVSSGRLHFWGVAWQVFLGNPILGAGLDAFGTAYPRFDTWNGNFRVEQAHNDYLQILADGGIVGLTCVIAFIVMLFRRGLRKLGHEHSLFRRSVVVGGLAGCLGIIVHSFFDFPLRTTSNAFYFLLFAVFATAHIHFSKKTRRR